MEKQEMETSGVVEGNLDKIATLFPQCITEVSDSDGTTHRVVDFDKLRKELGDDTVEGVRERYQFTWPQKSIASALANTKTRMTLRPIREGSVNFDTTENLYIEGDNLEVLKVLRETYLGRVKMIYIDPPYNTGNDFVYKDRRYLSQKEMDEKEGKFDEYGNLLVANTDSNGRFHTDWLNFIYPRLKVARDFLSQDGVIFISIDENELDNLKKICDEIFGASNFIAELIWAAGRKNDSKYISISHEYILCYFRNAQYIKENKIVWREKKQGLEDIYAEYEQLCKTYKDDYEAIEHDLKAWYKGLPNGHPAKDHKHYNGVDRRGIYFGSDISWPGGGGPKYEVLHPITKRPVKIPSRGWITNPDTLKIWIDDDRVDFGPDENCVPTLKAYLRDNEYSVPYSVFYQDGRAASKRLATLMGDKVFENPKDEEIIQRIISFCGVQDGDIVMDFFSGSGTTAQSIFLTEVEKGIKIKFILVQLQETISEKNATSEKSKKVAKAAIALCDEMGVPHNICEIAKERIRRSGEKVKKDMPENSKDLDTGFRVLRLDTSNMKDVFYNPAAVTQYTLDDMVTNVKEDRSDEDLLFQVMLQNNIPLSSKIEKINVNGHEAFNVNEGDLIAIFDRSFDDATLVELAKMEPLKFVMREPEGANGVNPDNLIDNFEQKFELYSPNTQRRIL